MLPSGIRGRVPEERGACGMSPNSTSWPSSLRRGRLLPLVPHLPDWLLADTYFAGCGEGISMHGPPLMSVITAILGTSIIP